MIAQKIILCLSNLSGIPAIVAGRRQRPALWYCVLASLLFDINGFILRVLDIERHWASNLFFLIEFVLISQFFILNIFSLKWRRLLFLFVAMVSLAFAVHTYLRSFWNPNYVGAAVINGIYITYCIAGLLKVIREIEYVQVERNPIFLFCIAIILYSSGSFIIFLFGNVLLIQESELIRNIWSYVRNPLNAAKNLLIAYGFIIENKKQ